MSAGREASGLDRLADLIDTWCTDRKMSLTEFARQAGVDRQTLYNLRSGRNSNLRATTKQGLERLFGWAEGGVDDFVAGREPTPREASSSSALRGVPDAPEETFESALEAYGHALQQLRRIATTDPNVPAKALSIIEDWEMMYTAMVYGGVDAVLRAIADSYRKGLPGEGSHGQTG